MPSTHRLSTSYLTPVLIHVQKRETDTQAERERSCHSPFLCEEPNIEADDAGRRGEMMKEPGVGNGDDKEEGEAGEVRLLLAASGIP